LGDGDDDPCRSLCSRAQPPIPFPHLPRLSVKNARARTARQTQTSVRRAASRLRARSHPCIPACALAFGDFIFTRGGRQARDVGVWLELRVLYRAAPCDGSLARQPPPLPSHRVPQSGSCTQAGSGKLQRPPSAGCLVPAEHEKGESFVARQVEKGVGSALLPRPDRDQRQRGEARGGR
jgi:hypothetical protein